MPPDALDSVWRDGPDGRYCGLTAWGILTMKYKIAGAVIVVALLAAVLMFSLRPPPMPTPPPWAYPVGAAGAPARGARDNTLLHVPNSRMAYTRAQTNDRMQVPDWHPDGHPPMPQVVAHGRKPAVFACGYCHLPNGQGRPENASLAAQPAAYMIEQVLEMRAGRRHSAQPKMGPPKTMLDIARHITDADLQSAIAYFTNLPYRPWIKVVETSTVPKSFADPHGMMAVVPGGGAEPIGTRIIEVAADAKRTDLRDDASGFVAYVPPGSIARGAALVNSGNGAQPCRTCHGPALKGLGGTPAIAGRSPSYVIRQLFDIQYGARSGPVTQPMQAEVAHMTDANRVDIAAYLASLKP
jgi:cytochrome c553